MHSVWRHTNNTPVDWVTLFQIVPTWVQGRFGQNLIPCYYRCDFKYVMMEQWHGLKQLAWSHLLLPLEKRGQSMKPASHHFFSLFFAKTVTMSYWEMSNIWLDEFHPLPYVTAEEVNSHGSNILYKQSMASGILKEKLPKEKETKSCPKRYNTPLSEYLSIYFYWDT